MARPKGFPLRDSVLKCPGRGNRDVRFQITRGAKNIDHDKLMYFALSVFWRGAVKVWNRGGDTTDLLDLGQYEEPIRLFLLGKAPVPKDVVVVASLWPFEQILTGVYHPRHARPEEKLSFYDMFFYVPPAFPSILLLVRLCLQPFATCVCILRRYA